MRAICRWARRRLPLLAGGDLVGPERRGVERHLVGCPGCRAHLQSLRGAVEVLREVADAELGTAPMLWPALERQIRESRRPEPSAWPRRVLWPGVAVAASVLLALAGAFARRPVARPTSPPIAPTAAAAPRVAPIPTSPASAVARNDVRRPRRRGYADAVSVLPRTSAPDAPH